MQYLCTAVLASVALLAQTGCVSATEQQVRLNSTGINANESVAILGRLHKSSDETEIDFIDCVSYKTRVSPNALNVMQSQDFRDAFFPWFEPRTAPRETEELVTILDNPELAKRFREVGVRYIVWIAGQTQRRDQSGTLQCAIATSGVPACFGFLSWDGAANYEATIWDVPNQVSVGKLSSEATGTSFVPAIVVPLPFIARVQASACHSLSEQLKSFIAGETVSPTV